MRQPTKLEIQMCALEAGISLSTMYGQTPDKLHPMCDSETLENFVRMLIRLMNEEKVGKE